MGKRYRSGTVSIDVFEIVDQIDDDDLLEEVRSRKLIVSEPVGYGFIPEEEIKDAHAELLRGRPAEALAILDRLIHPKWQSVRSAQVEYDKSRSLLSSAE